jgi:hypothetical protein
MVSGQSRMSDGAIAGFKINNDLTCVNKCGWTFGGIYNLIGGVHITYAT